MAKVIRILIFYPIHLLLAGIIRLRHWLYDTGFFASAETTVPVICLGNLELGGSGKTPMADYLLRNFAQRRKVAFLSRGYGRKTHGFRWLKDCAGPDESGDEPWFLYKRWGQQAVFAVDENRIRGIFHILENDPETDFILLDDAFQHRKIRPRLSVLLTPFSRPFFRNFLFPAGNLRDIRAAARRADVLCFTRAEAANAENHLEVRIQADNAGFSKTPVFISSLVHGGPMTNTGIPFPEDAEIICVAGLADNSTFFAYCKQHFRVKRQISLPDHYRYPEDFFKTHQISDDQPVLCTEKDYEKLKRVAPKPGIVFYLPIEIRLFPEAEFLKIIEEQV